jgi:predicted metal-dependent hydrolase
LLLLGKLYRKPIEESHRENYRRFILQQEVQEKARLARVARGRKPRTFHAAGRYHNLETSFERLNREYFAGSLERVSLSWSTRRSRHILGRYDSAHRAIYISRILDTADTPAYVVDYVLYHEMLHVRHQVRSDGCRLVVHSAEFRRQEQHFNHYSAAKKWLDRL